MLFRLFAHNVFSGEGKRLRDGLQAYGCHGALPDVQIVSCAAGFGLFAHLLTQLAKQSESKASSVEAELLSRLDHSL